MSLKVNIRPNLLQFDSYRGVTEVQGTTIGECLTDLVRQYPRVKVWLFDDKGELYDFVDIYVNGDSAFPLKLEKPVADGDELSIVVMIAGG